MIVSAHQPLFVPWVGFFNKYLAADKFVIVDNVQFPKKEFVNRNRVLGANGLYLVTIPVNSQNHRGILIRDIEISPNFSPGKIAQSLTDPYKKSKYSGEVDEIARVITNFDGRFLIDLNLSLIDLFCRLLGIQNQYLIASELGVEGHKSDYVLDLCLKTDATTYIFGSQGRNYVDYKTFQEKQINLKFQNFIRSPNDWYTFEGNPLGIIHSIANMGGTNLRRAISPGPNDFVE